MGYPAFIKPKDGSSSVDAYKVNTEKEFTFADCYLGSTNADLDQVPAPWGGYGFDTRSTGLYVMNITEDNYNYINERKKDYIMVVIVVVVGCVDIVENLKNVDAVREF